MSKNSYYCMFTVIIFSKQYDEPSIIHKAAVATTTVSINGLFRNNQGVARGLAGCVCIYLIRMSRDHFIPIYLTMG